jgi:hypothetical protein
LLNNNNNNNHSDYDPYNGYNHSANSDHSQCHDYWMQFPFDTFFAYCDSFQEYQEQYTRLVESRAWVELQEKIITCETTVELFFQHYESQLEELV